MKKLCYNCLYYGVPVERTKKNYSKLIKFKACAKCGKFTFFS